MFGHALGLLAILATQAGVILADHTTPLPAKIAALIGTAITVLFADQTVQKRITTAIIGVAGVAVPMLTYVAVPLLSGHASTMHGYTVLLNIATCAVGVFVRLQALYPLPVGKVTALLFGVSFGAAMLGPAACHNVTPDQFLNATVDCSKVNPQTPAVLGAVESCLLGVVTRNPGACLAGLVTDKLFAIGEVACVVAFLSQQADAKVASQSADTPDLVIRKEANNWLSQERIQIVNSYPAK